MIKVEPAGISDNRNYTPGTALAVQLPVGTWFVYPDSSKLFLKISAQSAWNFKTHEYCDLPVAAVVPVVVGIAILKYIDPA